MSDVYFTKDVTPNGLLKLFDALRPNLKGNIAIKLHSGEKGNTNFLKPEFFAPLINKIGGTVVECNTAYPGARNSTEKHKKLIQEHGWDKFFAFDLLDAYGPDLEIEIPNGKIIKQNYLGKNIKNYDSMLVLSHFKGHQMGGYGGALKQLSIGCASSAGKAFIHSAGVTKDQNNLWDHLPQQDVFLEAMADAASSVVNMFKGKIAFINVMKNISVDCDCSSHPEPPCVADIGILASLDPVSVDQACIDLVYNSSDLGVEHFKERVESRHGRHTIDSAEQLGIGEKTYKIINVD